MGYKQLTKEQKSLLKWSYPISILIIIIGAWFLYASNKASDDTEEKRSNKKRAQITGIIVLIIGIIILGFSLYLTFK
jgi:hypothetical protein